MTYCGVFWGSHGCWEEKDHEGQHICPHDCEHAAEDDNMTLEEHRALHKAATAEECGADGCVATWPYYGRERMTGEGMLKFFRHDENNATVWMPEEFARMEALHRKEKS